MKSKKTMWLIMLLPIGLCIGSVTSLIQHFRKEKIVEERQRQRASVQLGEPALLDSLEKLTSRIGDRNFETAKNRREMLRCISFLKGSLDVVNTGLKVEQSKGFIAHEKIWTSFWVDIPGKKRDQIVLIATSIQGKAELGPAARLSILMALANSVAGEKDLRYTLRFALLPEDKSPADLANWASKESISNKEELKGLLLFTDKATGSLDDRVEWTYSTAGAKDQVAATHTAFTTGKTLRPQSTKLILKAASEIRAVILRLANGEEAHQLIKKR